MAYGSGSRANFVGAGPVERRGVKAHVFEVGVRGLEWVPG